jgi:hypothetical protein
LPRSIRSPLSKELIRYCQAFYQGTGPEEGFIGEQGRIGRVSPRGHAKWSLRKKLPFVSTVRNCCSHIFRHLKRESN